MNEKNLELYRQMYQHCCDCQDLAESAGDWELFHTFEDLRNKLNRKMYS